MRKAYERLIVGSILDSDCTLDAVNTMAIAMGNAAHGGKASPDQSFLEDLGRVA